MLRKIAMLGLGLILTSGALFVWGHRQSPPLHQLFPEAANDTAIGSQTSSVDDLEDFQNLDELLESIQNTPQEENKQVQKARLMAKIDHLVAEDMPESALAETLYGPNWKVTVDRYKRLTEQQEFVTIASIVLGCLGIATMTLFLACASVRMIRFVVHASARSRVKESEQIKTVDAPGDALNMPPKATSEALPLTQSCEPLQTETGLKALHQPSDIVSAPVTGSLPYRRDDHPSSWFGCQSESEEASIFDLFLTDENSVHTRHPMGGLDSSAPKITTESVPDMKVLSSLETRTEDVSRQITDVQKLVTKDEAQASSGAEPFNATLQQLNDQISSIRQYASSQQDRVEKLQTGYDWNIIRTFCLRIIRCIDNLDDRIERLPDDSTSIEMLSDIRDEMLFALESSGVERFDLEHGSEFSGQERLAEAIKEKEISDDPELKGRIARVVKSGYQYIIDDENVKVVRTARIKLYG